MQKDSVTKGLHSAFACSVVIIGSVAGSVTYTAPAEAGAGEWTKCVAWLADGTRIHPTNGNYSWQACDAAGRRCAHGRPWGGSQYYSSPVIIEAPYERCTA